MGVRGEIKSMDNIESVKTSVLHTTLPQCLALLLIHGRTQSGLLYFSPHLASEVYRSERDDWPQITPWVGNSGSCSPQILKLQK